MCGVVVGTGLTCTQWRYDVSELYGEQEWWGGRRHDAHPMAIMCGVVGAFSAFYPQSADIR